jgi:hypothetical protein
MTAALGDTLLRARSAPFWRARLAQAGLGREIAPGALARLAVTRRAELLADQLAALPLGTRRPAGAPAAVRIGISGSGEQLLVLGFTAADLARERAAGTALLRALGVEPGMRVANTLPGALATPGSLLLGDVVEELGGLDVPLGEVGAAAAARAAWELVDRVRPEVLVLAPGTGAAFLAAAPVAERRWCSGLVWLTTGTPEPVRPLPPGAGLSGWQRTWVAVPEATSFAGRTCDRGRLHPATDLVVEVVHSDTGAALGPDQPGELVLTPLGLDTPCLRYATGLQARIAPEPCACGSPGTALEMPPC